MASESVPTLAMSSCTLGIEKAKLVPAEFQANVLEEIFKYLNVSDLLQVRCTCRRWKETVDDCSELMERVLIKFPENLVFDRNYQPVKLVPAKNVTFTESRVSSVQTWWPPIGHRLVHLTVKNCEMSFSMLVKVLKHTPELKRLDYLCPSYRAAVVDFGNLKLGKLECLSIDVPNEEILDIAIELRNLFPNLKTLKVLKQISTEALIKRKENLGDVLEEVHLKSAGKLMDGLLQIERLKCLDISGIVTNKVRIAVLP
uniref:(northern house mosquito) hypothetical protein n=1 Tax=Culex pipiens TaxID=7175 RepID=A0A8D8G0H7_CULPI